MLPLILRRLLQLPIILLVIYTLTLTLAWAVPGNPLDKGEGRRPPREVEEAMKAQYRLDSFWSFYWSYLDNALGVKWARERWTVPPTSRPGLVGAEAPVAVAASPSVRTAHPIFDLGPSLQYEDWRVSEIIGASLPVSVTLGFAAMVFATVVGVAAGVIGAVRPNSAADVATLGLALIGISLPSFVIGTALVLIFPIWLGVGPIGGWGRPGQMVLPAVTLGLPFAAYIARLTRMGMIEQLRADYIRTARAKGLSESRVVLGHALKNAILPVISFLGPASAAAMTGSFVVERVFFIPGMGQHFVNAVLNKDLFLIIGVVMIYSTMLVLLNLGVDVLYRWADPRIG